MKRRVETPHFLQNSGRGQIDAHAATLLRKSPRRMSNGELRRIAALLTAECDRRLAVLA